MSNRGEPRQDALDGVISATLRQRVARAAPPPHAWERIRERARRLSRIHDPGFLTPAQGRIEVGIVWTLAGACCLAAPGYIFRPLGSARP